MHLRVLRPLFCQQFLYRLHDPEPYRPALHIPRFHQFIGPHGGFNVGCFAVLFDEFVGRAVDVEVGGYVVAPSVPAGSIDSGASFTTACTREVVKDIEARKQKVGQRAGRRHQKRTDQAP